MAEIFPPRAESEATLPSAPSQEDVLRGAIQRHQAGRLEEAAAIYRRVLEVDPNQVDALHFLGVAEHQLGRSEAALEFLGRALALRPDHGDAHNNRGNILKSLGRIEEAEASYLRALELHPNDVRTLSNLGAVRRVRGNFEAAVATLRQALALDAGCTPAWQNLGNALYALERYEEALDAYREALPLHVREPQFYHHLGALYCALGRLEDGLDVYRKWQARFPEDRQASHLIAACTGSQVPERASDEYVREVFNLFASTFDASLAELEYRAPALVAEAVKVLFPDAAASLVVLDAGCGTGLCGPLLRPYARVLEGVDLAPRMVEQARARKAYDELFVDELTAYLGRQSPRFHLIVSADTLVYFGSLTAVLAVSAKALLPGGGLVFTVERSPPADAPSGYHLHPHGRFSHTREYVLEVLLEAGFVETETTEVALRKEAGQWVEGLVVTARVAR